jgi:uncharacterized UBP type Zn finger protein
MDRFSVFLSNLHVGGLRDLGATCYLNSVCQQLFRIPAFQVCLLNQQAEPDSAPYILEHILSCRLNSKR